MIRSAVGLLLVAIVLGSEAQPAEEAQIYAAAIRAAVPGVGSPKKRLAVSDTTAAVGEFWRALALDPTTDLRHRLSFARPETVESLLANGDTVKPLPRELAALPEYALFSAAEASAAKNNKGRQSARRRRVIEGAAVSFSSLGYDASRTQALVFVNYVCGTLCGHTAYVMLERVEGDWRVAKVLHAGQC
ncbi:MAG: hypothetical protein R2708_17230 [Vicinamibacterales bacterium]